ncbi:hypothetical protein AB0436_23320 [Streptomyces sp. NPDC051322]|uniref:hypothetical protein n=1 Tax=Streptomyces sp. NPDC051322 TaxID=3154645 RepID=UPI00344BB446
MSQPVPPPYPSDPSQPAQPPQGFGYPMAPPPAPVRKNLAGGVVVALVAAIAVGAAYGGILGATSHEIGYAAIAVGFIVGFAAGKVGGDHVALAGISAVLSLASIYFGQLLGEAIIAAKHLPVSVSELFFQHFGLLNEAWRADSDFMSYVFIVIAVCASFAGMKRAV